MTACACCAPSSYFWIGLFTVFLVIQIVHFCLGGLFQFLHLSKWYDRLTALVKAVSFIFVAFIAILANHKGLQEYGFSIFAKHVLLKEQPLDQYRCSHVQNVYGRVLEIGPGPGTNFRCWTNNTAITEWVGVEPNKYFQELLNAEKEKKNISFPTRTVWLKGEDVDVEPESFDFVVATHVLCSVDDVSQVIHQVKRALKPGGTYLFLEHVKAASDSGDYIWQQVFQPLITMIGAGCQFKELWNDLSTQSTLVGYEVQSIHQDLPMSISIFAPHVMGSARKPLKL